jgi:hypothetical protein
MGLFALALWIGGGAMDPSFAQPARTPVAAASSFPRLIEALRARRDVPSSFEATYELAERAGAKAQRTSFAMRFRLTPRASRLEVLESDHIPKGMRLRQEGGNTVRIRLPGPAGFMSMAVPARSPFSRGLTGLYPDQLTPDAFIAALLHPENRVRSLGTERHQGRTLQLVEVTGPYAIVPGATLRIGLSEDRPFPYVMSLRLPDGAEVVQTFTSLRERTFTEQELAI